MLVQPKSGAQNQKSTGKGSVVVVMTAFTKSSMFGTTFHEHAAAPLAQPIIDVLGAAWHRSQTEICHASQV